MRNLLYENCALVDTSAVIALFNANDPLHKTAKEFYSCTTNIDWFILNITIHETFTRCRYDMSLITAISIYDILTDGRFNILKFIEEDEDSARNLLEKYNDKVLSFHDALCASVMLRKGIYKIFSFDSDFRVLDFM
jgi:predicted nucleic acid-binding protein